VGIAEFSLKLNENIGRLKAISQNLMHENISVTDGIYGGLSDEDIKAQISSLTKENLIDDNKSVKELLRLTLERIEELKNKKNDF